METVFKSALRHIRADSRLKEHTRNGVAEALKPERTLARRRTAFRRRVVAAACAMVLLGGVSAGAYAAYQTPTSYLSLDINPSVELGVNFLGRVVSAAAYNNDGETILKGQNVRGAGVREAVRRLVSSAARSGFVAQDGSTVIAVTAETDSSSAAARLEEAAAQGAGNAVWQTGTTASVQKENVALERRKQAQDLGITPGKLNLIQKLQALDPDSTHTIDYYVQKYKDATVTEIMNEFVKLKRASLSNNGNPQSEDSDVSSAAGGSSQTSAADGKAGAVSSGNPNGNGGGNSKAGQANGNAGNSTADSATGDFGQSGKAGSGAPAAKGSAGSHENNGQSVADIHKK